MKIKRKLLFFVDKELPAKDSSLNKSDLYCVPNEKTEEKKYYLPDGKLRLRIRYDRNTVVNFNVGYRVNHAKWSKDTQRCKTGTTHGKKKISASEINREIQRLEDLAENVFKTFEVKDHVPTIDEYKAAFNKENGKETGTVKSKDTLFDVFDEFVRIVGKENQWTNATHTKFKAIRNHLEAFNPKQSLNNLSENDLRGFVDYMQNMDLRNTTIMKNVSFVRWFLRWASNNGYYIGNLHATWRPRLKGGNGNTKEVIHLTWGEVIHLYNFKLPQNKQYLDRVKDVFLFLCFTGLRYSDVAKLQRSDIYKDHISVVTQKTTDALNIELNKYSRAILDKYKDVAFPNDLALPVVSNQRMNDYLKELAKIAGIDEPQRIVYFKGNERFDEIHPKYAVLSTHCGRRTFIVNALYLGISPAVIMKWTGHSDFKAMKPYIKIVDELKSESMNKFNEK